MSLPTSSIVLFYLKILRRDLRWLSPISRPWLHSQAKPHGTRPPLHFTVAQPTISNGESQGGNRVISLRHRFSLPQSRPFAVFLSEDSPGVRRDGLLRLAEANKTGTPAADVSLLLADGSTATLGSIIQRTPETVLIFFDPECERCRELTLELSADIRLAEAIQSGEICVVALTPGVIFLQSPISSPKRGFMLPTPMAP